MVWRSFCLVVEVVDRVNCVNIIIHEEISHSVKVTILGCHVRNKCELVVGLGLEHPVSIDSTHNYIPQSHIAIAPLQNIPGKGVVPVDALDI